MKIITKVDNKRRKNIQRRERRSQEAGEMLKSLELKR